MNTFLWPSGISLPAVFKWMAVLLGCLLTGCVAKNYNDPELAAQPVPTDPGIVKGELDNGFRYWIRSTNASSSNHTINIRHVIRVGSIDENQNERGYTHLLEHVVFRAAQKKARLKQLIADAGLSWGADVNAYTYADRTEYVFTLSAEQIALVPGVFRFVSTMLDGFEIEARHLRAEVPIVEAEFRHRNSANAGSFDALHKALYVNTPWLGRPVQGHLADLRASTVESLQAFWDRHYLPSNSLLIVTGKIDPYEMQKVITAQFDALRNKDCLLYTSPSPRDS